MVTNPTQQIHKATLIKQVKGISDKYHNLSLLFYELSKSLEIQARTKTLKELKEYLGSFDFKRIKEFETKNYKELKK